MTRNKRDRLRRHTRHRFYGWPRGLRSHAKLVHGFFCHFIGDFIAWHTGIAWAQVQLDRNTQPMQFLRVPSNYLQLIATSLSSSYARSPLVRLSTLALSEKTNTSFVIVCGWELVLWRPCVTFAHSLLDSDFVYDWEHRWARWEKRARPGMYGAGCVGMPVTYSMIGHEVFVLMQSSYMAF